MRKRGANTPWVGARLAEWAGVPVRAVSWAGLKDRHAVTEQWFSIHAPRSEPDPARFTVPGVELLEVARHSRKLRPGTLVGNAFEIVLRGMAGAAESVAESARGLRDGFPNRFGRQRFGRGGANLARARTWFGGGRPPRSRTDRSMAVSAARALLFNAVVDARVEAGVWAVPVTGDIMVFDGAGGQFAIDEPDAATIERCSRGEIHPSGPLWGAGGSRAADEALEFEAIAVSAEPELARGLDQVAEPARRALRAIPHDLEAEAEGPDVVRLRFRLGAGVYATALLDELVAWRDPEAGDDDVGTD